ncbi:MAG: hypothetical protein GX660_29180, partial [Clostridiaceae bacterium]|nr:hypothetical protein [Clostridiaceae bacterium]
DGVLYIVEIDPPTPPDASAALPTKPLIEIADLNKPLGYKGNYIIFPLKRCSHITTFMSQEYIDDYFGVRDPGLQDGYTAEELLEYASAIWNDPEAALSDSERDALRLMVLRKLNGQDSSRETIIVPTGQLYMEALKGEQTLLEDFKLAHRSLDVIRAQEEIRELRLENLRYAQRLTSETPVLDEPSADKVIIVKGNSGVISIPAEGDER